MWSTCTNNGLTKEMAMSRILSLIVCVLGFAPIAFAGDRDRSSVSIGYRDRNHSIYVGVGSGGHGHGGHYSGGNYRVGDRFVGGTPPVPPPGYHWGYEDGYHYLRRDLISEEQYRREYGYNPGYIIRSPIIVRPTVVEPWRTRPIVQERVVERIVVQPQVIQQPVVVQPQVIQQPVIVQQPVIQQPPKIEYKPVELKQPDPPVIIVPQYRPTIVLPGQTVIINNGTASIVNPTNTPATTTQPSATTKPCDR
jgi:hypothetical protein